MKAAHAMALAVTVATLAAGCGSSEKAGSTAATKSASAAHHLSGQDRNWLAKTHQANLAEVAAGELAQKKGTTPAVRNAGTMLVTDHTALDDRLTRTADTVGVAVPKSVAAAQASDADRLGNERGPRFDQDFVATMAAGHEKAITDTQAEASHGSSPEVRQLAASALPTLNKHLATLKAVFSQG